MWKHLAILSKFNGICMYLGLDSTHTGFFPSLTFFWNLENGCGNSYQIVNSAAKSLVSGHVVEHVCLFSQQSCSYLWVPRVATFHVNALVGCPHPSEEIQSNTIEQRHKKPLCMGPTGKRPWCDSTHIRPHETICLGKNLSCATEGDVVICALAFVDVVLHWFLTIPQPPLVTHTHTAHLPPAEPSDLIL